jgi:hypothetical protein
MREVVKIPGDRCDGCVHTGVNEWDERVCYAFELPIGVSWKENKNTSRHRDCPYGNRVITVVMTDEEWKE